MVRSTAEWVRAAATGDRAAFEMLVNQYAAMVTGVAYSRCGDFASSEDIAQETFVEAWKNLATIHDPEKFPGWICTIARRRAIDTVRKATSTRSEGTHGKLLSEIPDPKQLTPEISMSLKEEREWVWAMLARLPEAYREPLVLFYRCEESTRDVAIALGESEATIRQRLKRGRDMLRSEMDESIRRTLGATLPKAAFAALVMASLPSAAYAAGAAATTATAAKSSSAAGTAVTSAVGGAFLGSLIGLTGGIFGTWMSWKNCEYESQQKFVLRQALHYAIGFSVFGILLAILVTVRLQGIIADDTVYFRLFIALIAVSQVLNFAWIWRCVHGYNQTAREAKRRGEPVRQATQRHLDRIQNLTRVTNADGGVNYEAFRWNAGGWFGSCAGSTAWMLPLTAIAFRCGSPSLGILTGSTFIIAVSMALLAWRFKERLDAYIATQFLIGVAFLMTTIVLAGLQFLGNAETQTMAQWSPLGWFVLFLFPVISLRMWWMRRSFQHNMSLSR